MLRYTHAAPFHGRLFNEASLEQSTNQLYPTIFSFPLASLLRKSIALHSLWFLNSVQHSMPEMFQRVVHILLISFPGVASLVPGYSRAAAASLGMWHLRVHLLGQTFSQTTLACWALWLGIHVAQVYRTCMSFDTYVLGSDIVICRILTTWVRVIRPSYSILIFSLYSPVSFLGDFCL